ncbi:MAG: helix-turn-helix transcriptional regulator [Lachnospiraceae bacterium]|nr:helix-turn-helix transcriptional regulator [Lachnospiraceae bacterium]
MDRIIPTIDMMRTGQRITQLRTPAGLSVKDLQNVFGFATPQPVYKWQQGASMPAIDNLVILSAVLGVAIDDIVVLADAGLGLRWFESNPAHYD